VRRRFRRDPRRGLESVETCFIVIVSFAKVKPIQIMGLERILAAAAVTL